ncbi:response regulator [Oceanobacter mangrovi]|uniref:response regulator n=1 Tax=Oceanobacter mangrovi TaxID=2862510 RepID=UPI001C8CF8BC|nr:response regulator [Oceanobacter mangrovi]
MSTKCLIADDSLYARLVLKDIVQRILPEVEFQEVGSGQQALESASANADIDWFLLDVNMLPPDGVETSRQLLAQGIAASRIALVTGNRSGHLLEEAEEMGICLINKAVSPDDVGGFMERLQTFFNKG